MALHVVPRLRRYSIFQLTVDHTLRMIPSTVPGCDYTLSAIDLDYCIKDTVETPDLEVIKSIVTHEQHERKTSRRGIRAAYSLGMYSAFCFSHSSTYRFLASAPERPFRPSHASHLARASSVRVIVLGVRVDVCSPTTRKDPLQTKH